MGNNWTPSQEAAMTLGGKSLLVSAAAGSGKTSVLTERIIRQLTAQTSNADISRMLIVTFTRAAAAELKAKIAKALTNALAEDPSNKHLANQLLLLSSADISTIDSFFQKIVRENFEQLGIPANFRIADESELLPLKHEVMESVIELFYNNYRDKTLETSAYSVTQNNPFAKMIDNLMSNRSDGKLIPLLLKYEEQFSSYPEGIGLLKLSAEALTTEADGDFFHSSHGKSILRRLESQFSNFLCEALKIKDSLVYDPDVFLKCDALISSDIDFCKAVLDAIRTCKFTAIQAVINGFVSKARFPTIKNKTQEVEYFKNWRSIFKEEIKSRQSLLSDSPSVISTQMHRTAEFASMLYSLFCEYQQRLYSEKLTRGFLDHNDIRSLLYRLLTDTNGNASQFSESLSARYDAVYIDEYQDVDFLQDRIFQLIGKDRRFMVGDIKQSIYGFRGSEPSIFASYRKRMPLYTDPLAGLSDGNCVFMSNNFRCNKSIIEFANSVCSFLFSACEETVGYREQDDLVYSKSRESKEPEAFVQVAVFDRKHTSSDDETTPCEEADEAIWTAAEISRLLKEEHLDNGNAISPSDIAILVRTKASGAAFARELKKRSIPVASESSTNPLHDPVLVDVLNLLRTIDNPYRDIPLSEFLMSPLGGFSLEELSEIRSNASNQKSLFDAMRMAEGNESIKAPLRKRLTILLKKIEELRSNSQLLTADRFLRLLYLDELLIHDATNPALLYLYDQARLYQKNAWCGLYGFLGHIDRLLESGKGSAAGFEKAESAVSIMTVHHSKGLEFPIVFLCASGSAFNRKDLYEAFVFHKAIGCATKLYDSNTAGSTSTILREGIVEQINEDITEESIRTLYVALTRARERLYVTGTLSGQWDKALAAATLVKRGNRRSILGCSSYLSWILAALHEDGNMPASCTLHHYTHEEATKDALELSTKNEQAQEIDARSFLITEQLDPFHASYLKVIEEHGNFVYDLAPLQGLPTKAAASKISPDLLDRLEDDHSVEQMIELMKNSEPSFSSILTPNKNVTAADIGTATHSFLQFCSFENLLRFGIDAEIKRLIHEGFMDEETLALVRRDQLDTFLSSSLMQNIKQAKHLYREQKFGIAIPLDELTKKRADQAVLSDHSIFVQGSIDLLLEMPDDRLLLFDYKTDHIDPSIQANTAKLEQKMRDAHGYQLSCYIRAVKQLFGKAPDKAYIYSLPLGRSIEIFTT